MKLGPNALKVLEARYLRRDASGELLETPEALCRRVAHCIAQAEVRFAAEEVAAHWEEAFFETLTAVDFLPNSPTLMNAGTPLGQLSACFVLPVEDSLAEIFEALKLMALITQSGGGAGLPFSHLRPKGARLSSTGGLSTGPLSFLRIFDCAATTIRHGGKHRGVNLGELHIDHPDILEFVTARHSGQHLPSFLTAVGMTDAFMEALAESRVHLLRDPRTGQGFGTVPAAELLVRLAQAGWESGEPRLLFLDAMNRHNPTPAAGSFEATDPCGVAPLLPYESCPLGSINLSHMTRLDAAGPAVDWEKLGRTARLGLRFLDNVIEVGRWPSEWTSSMVRANRKVGLGVMGFAELLVRLRIPYASPQAVALAAELSAALSRETIAASQQLAAERGVFPNWPHSVYPRQDRRLRNATRLAIAPAATISLLAGTSAGIEPLFAAAHRSEHGLDSPARDLFPTPPPILPEDHLRIQAAFQQHVDNAVAKIIHLPHTATVKDVAAIYRRAWELGLKGVSVYRDGSRDQQSPTAEAEDSPDEAVSL